MDKIIGRTCRHTAVGVDRMMVDNYVKELVSHADKTRLLKVYLFGSLTKCGQARTADLVVEVSEKAFLEFANKCIWALGDFHPIDYWDYRLQALDQVEYTLDVLGLVDWQIEQLNAIIPRKKIDILCLPVSWNEEGCVNKLLIKNFGMRGDSGTIKDIEASCVTLHE